MLLMFQKLCGGSGEPGQCALVMIVVTGGEPGPGDQWQSLSRDFVRLSTSEQLIFLLLLLEPDSEIRLQHENKLQTLLELVVCFTINSSKLADSVLILILQIQHISVAASQEWNTKCVDEKL